MLSFFETTKHNSNLLREIIAKTLIKVNSRMSIIHFRCVIIRFHHIVSSLFIIHHHYHHHYHHPHQNLGIFNLHLKFLLSPNFTTFTMYCQHGVFLGFLSYPSITCISVWSPPTPPIATNGACHFWGTLAPGPKTCVSRRNVCSLEVWRGTQ